LANKRELSLAKDLNDLHKSSDEKFLKLKH
jgi:hypothetical protein